MQQTIREQVDGANKVTKMMVQNSPLTCISHNGWHKLLLMCVNTLQWHGSIIQLLISSFGLAADGSRLHNNNSGGAFETVSLQALPKVLKACTAALDWHEYCKMDENSAVGFTKTKVFEALGNIEQ